MNLVSMVRCVGFLLVSLALVGCVPSEISSACKQRAVTSGFGKCSISKGRQNDYGAWVVKMDCYRGATMCQNDTAGSVAVYEWASMSDYLYGR